MNSIRLSRFSFLVSLFAFLAACAQPEPPVIVITASEIEIQSSVVLEAAASGLPVVAVWASSMPEFVHDGVTGYLVSPGDVTALAERLATLLQNPERAKTMGEAALAVAREHSNAKAIEAYEQLYESLIRSARHEL